MFFLFPLLPTAWDRTVFSSPREVTEGQRSRWVLSETVRMQKSPGALAPEKGWTLEDLTQRVPEAVNGRLETFFCQVKLVETGSE